MFGAAVIVWGRSPPTAGVAVVEVRTYPRDDRAGRRVAKRIVVDDVGTVDGHTELAEVTRVPVHLETRVRVEQRRHPGGNERLAGSDGAVVDVDASHGCS